MIAKFYRGVWHRVERHGADWVSVCGRASERVRNPSTVLDNFGTPTCVPCIQRLQAATRKANEVRAEMACWDEDAAE